MYHFCHLVGFSGQRLPTNHCVYAFATAREEDTDTFNQVIRFTDLRNKAIDKKLERGMGN
jgi:hypothetical protein